MKSKNQLHEGLLDSIKSVINKATDAHEVRKQAKALEKQKKAIEDAKEAARKKAEADAAAEQARKQAEELAKIQAAEAEKARKARLEWEAEERYRKAQEAKAKAEAEREAEAKLQKRIKGIYRSNVVKVVKVNIDKIYSRRKSITTIKDRGIKSLAQNVEKIVAADLKNKWNSPKAAREQVQTKYKFDIMPRNSWPIRTARETLAKLQHCHLAFKGKKTRETGLPIMIWWAIPILTSSNKDNQSIVVYDSIMHPDNDDYNVIAGALDTHFRSFIKDLEGFEKAAQIEEKNQQRIIELKGKLAALHKKNPGGKVSQWATMRKGWFDMPHGYERESVANAMDTLAREVNDINHMMHQYQRELNDLLGEPAPTMRKPLKIYNYDYNPPSYSYTPRRSSYSGKKSSGGKKSGGGSVGGALIGLAILGIGGIF